MAVKSIVVLYAGGTIGMVRGPSGLTPSRRFVVEIERWISRQPLLRHHHLRIETFDPLIDSADADPAMWAALARRIWTMRERVDAVVVLHGTDTLAYTASAISFLLVGFGKPVVVTGAQVPFSMPDNDGEANVLGAVRCALNGDIREVGVFFNRKLMRGNRTRKWSTDRDDAFVSPHWPALASLRQDLRIARRALLVAPQAPPPRRQRTNRGEVGLIKLYPGINASVISAAADAHPAGLVLELYGSGTGPAGNRAVRQTLQAITARGIPLVGVSQCLRGRISPGLYAAGQALADWGVASGHDLTPEAALTKLTYLRDLGVSADRIAGEIGRPLAGEVTAAS